MEDMNNSVRNTISKVKNPSSGKTLAQEDRIVDVKATADKVKIIYRSNDLSPEQKNILQSEINSSLSMNYKKEDISIVAVSKGSKVAPENKANLQTGHGPVGANKKKVANVKKVIAVSSGKGGVGKSTVAVNLALSLKNLGKEVGILDADIYGPSVPMLLGKRDGKPKAGESKKIIPLESNGIRFISFGNFISEKDPVIWRGPMLGGVLNQFLFDVDWGELDYLIIDLPPGTGDMQLSLVQATDIDGVVVVSTPQNVALLDSKKGLQMFNQVKVPILGMIENMSYFITEESDKKYFIFGEGGVEKAAKELDVDFLGQIPLEIELREGSDNGTPYMNNNSFEGRPVWNSFMKIATDLIQKSGESVKDFSPIANKKSKGLLGRIFS